MARQDFDLSQAPYLLAHADGQKTLQQKWVVEGGQTVAYVKANIVPNLFARYNALGWSDAEVMAMTLLPAYWNDAVISGNGGGQPINGVITSNNGVLVPAGVYLVNYPCITDGGEYIGQGTSFAGTPGGLVSMGTNLVYDEAGWIGGLGGAHLDGTYQAGGTQNIVFDQANLIQTTTWQVLSGARSYTESGYIHGFRLTGTNGSWYDVAQRRSNGLGYWDPGECSKVGTIFAETFNGSGIKLVRGTPATIDQLSSFQNAWSGIEFMGCDLSTININTLSGDDNPTMIGTDDGYGRVCSATINIGLIKSETGKRTPNKGQILYWNRAAAYNKLTIGAVQGNVAGLFIDAYFVIKNAANGRHMIHVGAFEGNNFRTLLHDVTGGKRYDGTAYRPESFVYSFRNTASLAGGRLQDQATGLEYTSSPVTASDRLGMVPINGSFDYAAGTPAYDIYGGGTPPPPPPACSWVTGPWSAWGPCVSGVETRTRTVDSSVLGCVPPGVPPVSSETQACGSPPPPPPPPPPPAGTLLYSIDFAGKNPLALPGCKTISAANSWQSGTISGGRMTTNINTRQQFATPIAGVGRIVLKAAVINDVTPYKYLNDDVRSNGVTKLYAASGPATGPAIGTYVQNGPQANITITFASPVTLSYLLGYASNSLIMSLSGIDVYSS